MTSTRFLIGVAVGAVGAWWFFGRGSSSGAPGIGGARGNPQHRQQGRNARYSGFRGQL